MFLTKARQHSRKPGHAQPPLLVAPRANTDWNRHAAVIGEQPRPEAAGVGGGDVCLVVARKLIDECREDIESFKLFHAQFDHAILKMKEVSRTLGKPHYTVCGQTF